MTSASLWQKWEKVCIYQFTHGKDRVRFHVYITDALAEVVRLCQQVRIHCLPCTYMLQSC